MRRSITRILGGLAVLVIVGLAIALYVKSGQARSNALRADSLEAVADTQRLVMGSLVRRVVQADLRGDSLDRALKAKPVARFTAALQVKPVTTTATAPVTEEPAAAPADSGAPRLTDPVRLARFVVDTGRYHATADVRLPAPPALGSLTLGIRQDPIPIAGRFACGTTKVGGIRPAYFALDTIPGVDLQLGQLQQSADVCNSRPGFAVSLGKTWWVALAGAVGGFLVGAVLSP